jgi:hypothetical protein
LTSGRAAVHEFNMRRVVPGKGLTSEPRTAPQAQTASEES